MQKEDVELAGQVAIVTGGGSGIGRAICFRLAQAGAKIAIFDRNRRGYLPATAEALAQAAGRDRVLPIVCDVSQEAQVLEAFERVLGAWERLDIAVCNAGLIRAAPFEESTLEQFHELFDVLVTGYYLVAREAFRVWKRQGPGGRLVFNTSKNAVAVSAGASLYCAAKAAEQHLARCLAEEGGPYGIRVNSVSPGYIMTELVEPYKEYHAVWAPRIPLGRLGRPEELVGLYLYLASDASSYMTGTDIVIDGGYTCL